jgi:aminomethyltransferase
MAAYRRIQQEGVANKVNGVIVDGEPFPALNNTKWPVAVGGRVVGKVTSAIYSPRLGANIGYAWLPTEHSHPGQEVRVETEWGGRDATVTPMPFVDPQKKIPLS